MKKTLVLILVLAILPSICLYFMVPCRFDAKAIVSGMSLSEVKSILGKQDIRVPDENLYAWVRDGKTINVSFDSQDKVIEVTILGSLVAEEPGFLSRVYRLFRGQ